MSDSVSTKMSNVRKQGFFGHCNNRIIIILLFVSFFAESQTGYIGTVGGIATFLIPLYIGTYFLRKKYTNSQDSVDIFLLVVFMVLQAIGIRFNNFNNIYRGVIQIYRTFSILVVTLYARRCKFDIRDIKLFTMLNVCLIFVCVISLQFPNTDGSDKLFGNYNTVGAIFFTLAIINILLFFINGRKLHLFIALGNSIVINMSNTRSAILLLIILIAGYLILKGICKRRVNVNRIYLVFFIIIAAAVFVYYNVNNYEFMNKLNELSVKYFGKRLDTGRPRLWQYAVQLVGAKFLTGLGTGASIMEFSSHLSSTHSTYFEMYLQNGIMGVALYLACIISVISHKRRGDCDKKFLIIGTLVVCGILFYNAVGVIFLRARSGMGLLQWFIMALPYNIKIESTRNRRILYEDKRSGAGLQCA